MIPGRGADGSSIRGVHLWVLAAMLLITAPAQGAEVAITEEAREHFRTGVALLDDPAGPRFEEAYHAFQAAFAASPSPKILGNLGLCAMMLERDGEAIAAYERYLREVEDISARERSQIERDLSILRASAVEVRIAAPPATVVVDRRIPVHGSPVVNRYGPVTESPLVLRVRAGTHELVLTQGSQSESFALEAQPGKPQEIRFEPETRPVVRSGVPTAAIVALAATGTLAIASFVTGGLALERQSAFEDANDGDNPEFAAAIRQEGQALNAATDVLLAGAIVGSIATTILFFVLTNDDGASLSLGPIVGPGEAGARVKIRF